MLDATVLRLEVLLSARPNGRRLLPGGDRRAAHVAGKMLTRAARCIGAVVDGAGGLFGPALRPALGMLLLEEVQGVGVQAQGGGVGFDATGEEQQEHGRDGRPHDGRRAN